MAETAETVETAETTETAETVSMPETIETVSKAETTETAEAHGASASICRYQARGSQTFVYLSPACTDTGTTPLLTPPKPFVFIAFL